MARNRAHVVHGGGQGGHLPGRATIPSSDAADILEVRRDAGTRGVTELVAALRSTTHGSPRRETGQPAAGSACERSASPLRESLIDAAAHSPRASSTRRRIVSRPGRWTLTATEELLTLQDLVKRSRIASMMSSRSAACGYRLSKRKLVLATPPCGRVLATTARPGDRRGGLRQVKCEAAHRPERQRLRHDGEALWWRSERREALDRLARVGPRPRSIFDMRRLERRSAPSRRSAR